MPAGRDIIVLGASAGGIEALTHLVHGLPPGLPAALFVVSHVPDGSKSHLPEILSRHGPLLAVHAQDREPIRLGQIYVAPPGDHLTLEQDVMLLSHGARENGHRPAIDPLFRSAARVYGRQVIGVILSGSQRDGTAGLLAVRSAGGVGVVQDPAEALVPMMPLSAKEIAGADYVLPVAEIPALLAGLVRDPFSVPGDLTMADPLEAMSERVVEDMAIQQRGGRRGEIAIFTCPECGGCMWQVDEQGLTRFRCHVGHAYYAESLLAEQTEALEAALWTAARTFKEKTILCHQLAAQERERGRSAAAERFEEDGRLAEQYGRLIQDFLSRGAPGTPHAPERSKEARTA